MSRPVKFLMVSMAVAGLLTLGVQAAPSQGDVSKEINLITNAATAVVAGLQAKINAGTLPAEEADAGKLRQAFLEQFRKLANADFQQAPDPKLEEIRKAFAEAFDAPRVDELVRLLRCDAHLSVALGDVNDLYAK